MNLFIKTAIEQGKRPEIFESFEQMVEYGTKAFGWYHAGHRRNFINYYLSDYCLDRIYDIFTKDEVNQLREYQNQLREEHKKAEKSREWKLTNTIYWADNSVEEIYTDKDGKEKTIMVVAPHGDSC